MNWVNAQIHFIKLYQKKQNSEWGLGVECTENLVFT